MNLDLQSQLIESRSQKTKGGWNATLASLGAHGAIVALIVFMSVQATQKVTAEIKPMRVYLSSHAAPPPPPPPPPPAASSTPSTPKPVIKPVQVQPTFVQPRQIPTEIPKVELPTTQTVDTTPSQPANDQPAGQPGGVEGGVAGGVAGGVVGGIVGGEVGGQIGGVVGGTPGSTTTEAPAPSAGPLRVGGDVKAPVVTHRVQPNYTEPARKARVQGVVVVEAIINKNGQVESVKTLRGLPMGLTEQAAEAVKEWRFRPGTLNGEPVEVIFTLTVNFTLAGGGADAPKPSGGEATSTQ